MNKHIRVPDDVPLNLFVGNSIGAFSHALNDKIDIAIREATGLSTSACHGIVQIGSEPGSTIEFLRRLLNLDHSTVVRLVDRLQKHDLIKRRRNNPDDRREVNVFLTSAGEKVFSKILDARRKVLTRVLDGINCEEQFRLLELLERLIPKVLNSGHDQHVVCRLCELEVCHRDYCPVNNSVSGLQDKYDKTLRR